MEIKEFQIIHPSMNFVKKYFLVSAFTILKCIIVYINGFEFIITYEFSFYLLMESEKVSVLLKQTL